MHSISRLFCFFVFLFHSHDGFLPFLSWVSIELYRDALRSVGLTHFWQITIYSYSVIGVTFSKGLSDVSQSYKNPASLYIDHEICLHKTEWNILVISIIIWYDVPYRFWNKKLLIIRQIFTLYSSESPTFWFSCLSSLFTNRFSVFNFSISVIFPALPSEVLLVRVHKNPNNSIGNIFIL